MNAEQELRAIRFQWRESRTLDTDEHIDWLFRLIDERDAIIHDLQLDGSALARRAVEEFIQEMIGHIKRNWPQWELTLVRYLTGKLSIAHTPDPLPPDQARQECERLRQQIDELLSGCGSHSCKVQRPHGQGVNGPCRCVEKLRAARGEEYTP